ncbi:NTP transferase domain-containing protein [Ramlibacter sp. G-1-2-2]|uniref:NTP transferase domain-containing protein n=1 Tax=Ramlibacter agri TaxID=2728837 RepID=A0A848GVR5_9BURK|nr:sugar phosphate nucleotidyltransferase [Ramlibacter agri]NML42705.1 NTP transferase domain-containing protein [Ramlibacter agri]
MHADAPELAVILVGGLGTRIRHLLQGRPKPLAPVAGKPFLEWVIRYLQGQGVRRIVLAAGYAGDQVQAFAESLDLPGVELRTVIEPEPRGTAGGFLHAWRQERPAPANALVLNGDSLALVPLAPLFAASRDPGCAGAILAVQVDDAGRYGTLDVATDSSLWAFAEKRGESVPGLVNAGVYLLPHATVTGLPVTSASLSFETEVFPGLVASGQRVRVASSRGAFLDIGTEASLAQADAFIRDNPSWFQPKS